MKKIFLVFAAVLYIQICSSASPGEAEDKLRELREWTTKKIDEAFFKHSRMSRQVDATALHTKQHGLEEIRKKTEKVQAKLKSDQALTHRCRGSRDHIFEQIRGQHSEELIKCVDEEGNRSVKVLSDQRMSLVEYVWNAIYEEERQIIVCGRERHCLDAAFADIQDKIDEVSGVIDAEVNISQHNTEVQVQSIKGCASRCTANAEEALGKVHTCTYV